MNKRKIIILLVLCIAVIGFTMGPACAAYKTVKIGKSKNVGHGDKINTFYQKADMQFNKGVYVELYHHSSKNGDYLAPFTYRLTKVQFFYKNKKGKVITRTVKAKNVHDYALISSKKIKGYTPYKADVYYRKMTEKEKKLNRKYNLS